MAIVVGFLFFGCIGVNLDDATKEFIKCMLENHDATIGILTGPLRAVPRGQHIRTTRLLLSSISGSRCYFVGPDGLFVFYF